MRFGPAWHVKESRQEFVRSRPFRPIDSLFPSDFQPLGQQVVGLKDHQIIAVPSGGWGDQAVDAKERERGTDDLRPAVVAFTVAPHVDAQRLKANAREISSVFVVQTPSRDTLERSRGG